MRLVRINLDPALREQIKGLSHEELHDLSSKYIRWVTQLHAYIDYLVDKDEFERRQSESGNDEVGFSG